MGNVINKEMSLKEIQSKLEPITRGNKRIEIEKLNMIASLEISACKKLKKEVDMSEVISMREGLQKTLESNTVDKDVLKTIFDSRLENLNKRVKVIEALKLKNGGFLKAGTENSLKNLKEEVAKVLGEQERMLKPEIEVEDPPEETEELEVKEPILIGADNGKASKRNSDKNNS